MRSVSSTIEGIFSKRIRLIFHLQAADFTGEEYQKLRGPLVEEVTSQVTALASDRIYVRMKRKYVDKTFTRFKTPLFPRSINI